MVPDNKELPKIDLGVGFQKQRIRQDLVSGLEDDALILARCQPYAHPLLKLRNRHGVAVSLVANELMVQFCECGRIFGRGGAVLHVRLSKHVEGTSPAVLGRVPRPFKVG